MTDLPPPAAALPPPPPSPVPPAPPAVSSDASSDPGAPSLPVALGLGALVAALCFALWWALEDTILETEVDTPVVWVPMAMMAAAGLVWAAASPGPARAVRLLAATVAGAATGAAGAFAVGRTELHQDALATGEINIGYIAGWAALGAAAWAITLGVASQPHRRTATLIGAAAGGAVSGGVMGALVGQWVSGDPARAVPTDIWWSLPLEGADVGPRVIPALVVGIVVPMLCAAPTRDVTRSLGRAGAVLAVLAAASVAYVQTGGDDVRATVVDPDGPTPDVVDVTTPDDVDIPTDPADDDPVAVPAVPTAAPAVPTAAPAVPTAEVDLGAGTVDFPYDTGFEVYTTYASTNRNTAIETATVEIAIGPAIVADSAVPISTGELVCPIGANDAIFPFLVVLDATGVDDTTKVRVTFGQGGVVGADPVAHPLSVQWNYAGGRQCLPGTATATDPASPAESTWSTLRPGEPQSSYGYLVVKDYFDPAGGPAPGSPSAAMGVGVVIEDQATTSEFQVTGGDLVTVIDPSFGEYKGVLFG